MDINALKKSQGNRPVTNSRPKQPFNLGSLGKFANKDIKLFSSFGDKQKERFFSEIGMLLSAGIDLQTILQLSVEGSKTKNTLNTIYESILYKVTHGATFASAMEDTHKFNNFDCYSVLIGENTGELAHVFQKLGSYYNKRIVQRRKISSSLSYPIIVLLTAAGAIYFMLKFVVPMFSETLVRFGGELPPLTQFIINLSHNIGSYFLIIIAIATGLYFLYRRNRKNEVVQRNISSFILKIPYIGKLVFKTHLVQFTQAMDLLLNSRVTVVESIELTRKIIGFYPLKKVLDNIRADLLKGDFFYKSMERQKYFDMPMITLVRIGEEINQLDKIFVQLSKQYENELEYQSNVLITVLEPLMIFILAVLVATILIAMYLPMFKIGTVIH